MMLNKVMKKIGFFVYKQRYIISSLVLVLLIATGILQTQVGIAYSYSNPNKVMDIFPEDDVLVIVYDNNDEGKIYDLVLTLYKDQGITEVQCYANTLGKEMSAIEMSSAIGLDESFVNVLFYIYENGYETEGMDLVTFINFLNSDAIINNEQFSSLINEEDKAMLSQYAYIINNIAADYQFSSQELSMIFEIDVNFIDQLFILASQNSMTLLSFTTFIIDNILPNPAYSTMFTEEQIIQLNSFQTLCGMINNNIIMTASQLAQVLPIKSAMFNENTLNLLFLMYQSNITDLSNITISIYDFFMYISKNIIEEEIFALFLDNNMVIMFDSYKEQMESGKSQLIGGEHSRLILSLNYELESKEINDFYNSLNETLKNTLSGNYYMIGNSAMSYELSKSFKTEYLLISILIAIVIFLVICVTFKKFSIPAFLVLIIECAVFITMSVMVIANTSMYFIALLIVQSLLMGSTIDYGILLTSYYREARQKMDVKEAVSEALINSSHTILTSSLIMMSITGILGIMMSGAVSSILSTVAIGSLSATVLVLFALPALLAIFDRFIVKGKNEKIISE